MEETEMTEQELIRGGLQNIPQIVYLDFDGAETVYRTPTGKRYHLDSYCAGVNYIESTVEESTALGLTPCKKCAGG